MKKVTGSESLQSTERLVSKEWLVRKQLASQVLATIRLKELRDSNAERSFREFLDLWEFYQATPPLDSSKPTEESASGEASICPYRYIRITIPATRGF